MGHAIYTNLKCALLAMRYAKFQGVKPGESFAKQLTEVIQRHPDWLGKVEECDKDIDLMTGDMREKGKKVFNLNEYMRQKENIKE